MKLKTRTFAMIAVALVAGIAMGGTPSTRDRQSDRQNDRPAPSQQNNRPSETRQPQNNRQPQNDSRPIHETRPQPSEFRQPPQQQVVDRKPTQSGFGFQNPFQQSSQDRRPTQQPDQERRPVQQPTEFHRPSGQHNDDQPPIVARRPDDGNRRPLVKGPKAPQNLKWGAQWRNDDRGDFHSSFHFGLYLFSPTVEASYISPWYDYSVLPAYVPADSVNVVRNYRCGWTDGSTYTMGGFDRGLNVAVDDIRNAFLGQDFNDVSGLISSNGEIGISNQGQYLYSVDPGEFSQMMADNVGDVQTISFQIDSVTRFNGGAIVHAEHVVQASDGGQDTVFQTYRLRANDNGTYSITDFMTSN